jgi:hypothetical protein
MAEHTSIPTNTHDEAREEVPDKRPFSHDIAGGELDQDATALKNRDLVLPPYQQGRDSQSTLGVDAPESEEDVSEEDLATLRRVSDRIPMSAWFIRLDILLISQVCCGCRIV